MRDDLGNDRQWSPNITNRDKQILYASSWNYLVPPTKYSAILPPPQNNAKKKKS